jgi:hypothetical protein
MFKGEIWQIDRNRIFLKFLDSLIIRIKRSAVVSINPIHLTINPLRSSIIDLNHVDHARYCSVSTNKRFSRRRR